ncbi:MAG TPA: helicase-exonuclease AddAB subunit AddB [Symbiobacteriaceae bacterium]
MGLRFIIGSAGSGKTHTCLEEIAAAVRAAPEGPPLILLVPEQATFQVEQALLGHDRLKGIMRAQVLSFQRLAWRVSMKVGGLAQPPLSDLGKRMVLRALLERRQGELRIFGQVADRPGFIEKLAGTISEVRAYQQGPDSLRRHLNCLSEAGQAESALFAKLHDLALVMQDLADYTEGRFTDPDDYLPVLAGQLSESGLLDGAEVWVDGFSGFTPQELAVLGAIFASARRTHVTLCIAPDELRKAGGRHTDADLFHPTLTTYDQLTKLAKERGIPIDPPLILRDRPRFQRAPELAYIEEHLFRVAPPPWTGGAPRSVTLVEAQNRREEVDAAAREVLRLVREEGLRYREIAVVARNLDAYGDLTAAVFAAYGIPAFVDRRRTVAHHPLVELLRAALEVVTQNWEYGPVFRYLKTDLTAAGRDEVDLLENYVIEHGIRGQAWRDPAPWRFVRRYTLEEDEAERSPDQEAWLERIHEIRTRATAELVAFQRRLTRRGGTELTVREITTALFQLLDDLKVAARLEQWAEEAEAAGDLELAREHEQVWNGVLELMDQMVEALGDVRVSLTQYLQILSAGLDGLRLGLIPPGLDQVIVGTVERSRHVGIRATLILGATEKDFPPQPPEDAIFTDRERERLKAEGLEVGPTSLEQLFQQQFFTYVALTRASDRLWISYPLVDETGRAVAPSPVIQRLRNLFPDLQVRPAVDPARTAQAVAQSVENPIQLGAALARAFRLYRSGYPLDPGWLDLYQWAVHDPHLQKQIAPVLASVAYEEWFHQRSAPIGRDLARLLYGDRLRTSVSRLEAFTACPFQHFAGYGLALGERPRFEVRAPEFGLFYHAALSLFVRQLAEEGRAWESLTPEEAAERMDRLVDLLAPRLQNEILLSTPEHRYLLRSMRRTLQASLRILNEHIYHGRFRPLWVELPFGSQHGEGLPPVAVPLSDGSHVLLRGRIDRVDGLQVADGIWYLRVIDYKSSARKLDLAGFYHGLSLQLLLYLYVVVEGAGRLLPGQRRPAGALYFPVHDPVVRLPAPQPPEQVEKERRSRFRATGILTDEPDVICAMDEAGLGLTQVAKLNKDGTVPKKAPVASQEQFAMLFGHLRRTITRAAERMLEGQVDVAPYRLGRETPCSFCAYRPVCQFDPTVEGQGYRSLERLKPAEVWQRIAEEVGEHHV